MSGERGMISFLEKKKILKDLEVKEAKLIKHIEKLEYKNLLLSDNLDLDYVEILIRERFLFGRNNEKIYIIKNHEEKN
jgi:hypothetical protein|tara:strand:- start:340 stop:573 length:234 start_codon:yes stop_codon:yes gene_type:complete